MITRKILIVEDEPSVAVTFQHTLKKSLEYNYVTESLTSAESAFEAIRNSGPYDVILLDYFLPGMGGADFLRTLRSQDQRTVVIVISASQDYRTVHDAFKLGADDFLSKEELTNPYMLEKAILAGLEKKEYQKETAQREISRQRLDAISTVVRTIHHELNNPMAIITLAASRLSSSSAMKEQRAQEHLQDILAGVERMSQILKRLPHLREESFNEELRGLRLYTLPDQKEDTDKNQ